MLQKKSPEEEQPYVPSYQNEIWTFGSIIYNLLTFKFPFEQKDFQLVKQLKGPAPTIPLPYSEKFRNLFSLVFTERPNLTKILKHLYNGKLPLEIVKYTKKIAKALISTIEFNDNEKKFLKLDSEHILQKILNNLKLH